MLLAAPGGFTRASLRAAIVERFGEQARFYACSADDMSADDLIDFLAARQKFVEHPEGALEADPSKMCNHGEDGHHH
jgi:probable metal-binding protein